MKFDDLYTIYELLSLTNIKKCICVDLKDKECNERLQLIDKVTVSDINVN